MGHWLSASLWVGLAATAGCANEDPLTDDVDANASNDSDEGSDRGDSTPDANVDQPTEPSRPDAGNDEVILPGDAFAFTLAERVYVDLSIPAVVQPASNDTFTWDLLFEGLTVYTNSGGVGPGLGASFGPSSELDLLFDTAPAVPLRADVRDNALLAWYWFGPNGISSRFHTYGVRDAQGRLFKLQVLNYYDNSQDTQKSAVYTLRYAEVTADGVGQTVETSGIDASAGGVTLPPSSPAGCIKLASDTALQLAATEWSTSNEWDLCFQRTEVLLNVGSPETGGVVAIDLDIDPNGADEGVTTAEQEQTAEGALTRFDELDYAALTQPGLPWSQEYGPRARIGTRWLDGSLDDPNPIMGSWIIRGADGQSHYALYFTDVSSVDNTRRVNVQVKPLSPPTLTE